MTHAAGVLALCAIPRRDQFILKKPSPELILDAIEKHRATHSICRHVIYNLLDHPVCGTAISAR